MAPSFCTDLGENERRQLLQLARQSVRNGLDRDDVPTVDRHALPEALNAQLGVFVTLTQRGKLRGCIGSLEASEPLAQAVASAAYSAAFSDPRFPELAVRELEYTRIEISILSPMEPITVTSRAELLSTLRPELDGLLLQDRHYRSTFLPKVWQQLPEPGAFLDQLLSKAGLPVDHWSTTITFCRYQTVTFSEARDV